MTDSKESRGKGLAFGPQWIQKLQAGQTDGIASPPATPTSPTVALGRPRGAPFRYSRDEILAVFDSMGQLERPACLAELPEICSSEQQPAMARVEISEKESYLMNKGYNSAAVLKNYNRDRERGAGWGESPGGKADGEVGKGEAGGRGRSATSPLDRSGRGRGRGRGAGAGAPRSVEGPSGERRGGGGVGGGGGGYHEPRRVGNADADDDWRSRGKPGAESAATRAWRSGRGTATQGTGDSRGRGARWRATGVASSQRQRGDDADGLPEWTRADEELAGTFDSGKFIAVKEQQQQARRSDDPWEEGDEAEGEEDEDEDMPPLIDRTAVSDETGHSPEATQRRVHERQWYYKDQAGQVQGPFGSAQMLSWDNDGYFPVDLLVRRGEDDGFIRLAECRRRYNGNPFNRLGRAASPPAFGANGAEQQQQQQSSYTQPMINLGAEPLGPWPVDQSHLLQIIQSTVLEPERRKQREELEQKARELREQEEKLKREQAEIERVRRELEEQKRQQLEEQQEAERQRRIEEEQRLQEEAIRKQEEAAKLQKMQEEAARKQRLQEEAAKQQKLQEEAERQQRLQEEVARQKILQEEAARKQRLQEEAERQQRLQEEAARQQRLQEEAARQKRLQEEAARQQRLQEEAARQQRIQEEAEKHRRLQEEASIKQRVNEESISRPGDPETQRQMQLIKQLEEVKWNKRPDAQKQSMPAAARWASVASPNAAPTSLIEIQRAAQEEMQREQETQRQLNLERQREQHQQQQQQHHQRQQKGASPWANMPAGNTKTLAEIQAEESRRVANQRQQQHQQQQQQQQFASPSTLWAGKVREHQQQPQPQQQQQHAPVSIWNLESLTITSGQPKQQQQQLSAKAPKQPAQTASRIPAASSSSTTTTAATAATSRKARGEVKAQEVMRSTLEQAAKSDPLTAWCQQQLRGLDTQVDIPTLVELLRDIEDPYDVVDYIKGYLGDTERTRQFGHNFLKKRLEFRSQERNGGDQHLNSLGQSLAGTAGSKPAKDEGNHFQQVGGNKKKKKAKKMKVHSDMLGFTSAPSASRSSVGQIESAD